MALENSDPAMALSADNHKGLVLALSSSLFIGASFIIKKKGLKRAGASGIRAGRSRKAKSRTTAADGWSSTMQVISVLLAAGTTLPLMLIFLFGLSDLWSN